MSSCSVSGPRWSLGVLHTHNHPQKKQLWWGEESIDRCPYPADEIGSQLTCQAVSGLSDQQGEWWSVAPDGLASTVTWLKSVEMVRDEMDCKQCSAPQSRVYQGLPPEWASGEGGWAACSPDLNSINTCGISLGVLFMPDLSARWRDKTFGFFILLYSARFN